MAFPNLLLNPATLLTCIPIAAALVYLPFMVVGIARAQLGYEMSSPRAMFDRLPPYAQRATWAHENGFESFMIFAAAAGMGYVTGLDSIWAIGAGLVYLLARSLYAVFYIADIPLARSLMYAIGSLCMGILFIQSCYAAWLGTVG